MHIVWQSTSSVSDGAGQGGGVDDIKVYVKGLHESVVGARGPVSIERT